MTLLAAAVTGVLGFEHDEALTLGRAVARLNAYSQEVSLGLFRPAPKEVQEQRRRMRKEETVTIDLFHHAVPAKHTDEGLRALSGDNPIRPESVEKSLEGKSGDALLGVFNTMLDLAKSLPPSQLGGKAYALCEKFRPIIPLAKMGGGLPAGWTWTSSTGWLRPYREDSPGEQSAVRFDAQRAMGQDRHIFSLTGRQKSAPKGNALFLLFLLLIASCGGSTGTGASGASSGTDYGKKTVYSASWRIIYCVDKDRVYTNSWSLAYHLEGNNVYDTSWRLVARIDGDRVYSEDWSLLYRIDGNRIYDPNWRLVYYVEDR